MEKKKPQKKIRDWRLKTGLLAWEQGKLPHKKKLNKNFKKLRTFEAD